MCVILVDQGMGLYFACQAIERGFTSVLIKRDVLVMFQQESDTGGVSAIQYGW